MTDAHCHVPCGDPGVREFLIGRDFVGVHPWNCSDDWERRIPALRAELAARAQVGVGEIGLDRLKERTISPQMHGLFEAQLKLAFEFRRPVVLHGAKCWGQVVKAVRRLKSEDRDARVRQPDGLPLLFHGFSRSDGLIPDIIALGGYISVGPAVLNDHAVNYRELVKKIPLDRLLLETDRTLENAAGCPSVAAVAAAVAALRGLSVVEIESVTDHNASAFF